MLFRLSFIADEARGAEINPRPEMASSGREEVEGQTEEATTDTEPEIAESDGREEETNWPQVSKMNATLQIPSLNTVDPLVSHGGSTYQKTRLAQELVREKKDPPEHVEKSSTPEDVLQAVRFIAENVNRVRKKEATE